MGETAEANERIVCAILAEQVAALRERMDSTSAFELLWRTSALLSWLSGLLGDMSAHATAGHAGHAAPASPVHPNPVLERERRSPRLRKSAVPWTIWHFSRPSARISPSRSPIAWS